MLLWAYIHHTSCDFTSTLLLLGGVPRNIPGLGAPIPHEVGLLQENVQVPEENNLIPLLPEIFH